jgi:hypothetical protein
MWLRRCAALRPLVAAIGDQYLAEHNAILVVVPARSRRATRCGFVAARPGCRWSPRLAIRIFPNM